MVSLGKSLELVLDSISLVMVEEEGPTPYSPLRLPPGWWGEVALLLEGWGPLGRPAVTVSFVGHMPH